MRIAIIDRKKCAAFSKCDLICMRYCPVQRAKKEVFKIVDKKIQINEELCIGCGICVKKCPFNAIKIVNIPDEYEKRLIHSYGKNSFRLYGLPHPKLGEIIGILGKNGIGKTTSFLILSGKLLPNFGKENIREEDVLNNFRGKSIAKYFEELYFKKIKISQKPQYIGLIKKKFKGKVSNLIKKFNVEKVIELLRSLNSEYLLERRIEDLSGGELQKLLVCLALSKDANVFLIDEPSSHLDIIERVRVSNLIRNQIGEDSYCMVIDHDLLVIDLLADYVYIFYGTPGAYGVVSSLYQCRVGINAYLDGFLRADNVRFREWKIIFEEKKAIPIEESETLLEWEGIKKRLGDFELKAQKGKIRVGEIIGILGKNGIGKTTFLRIIANELSPDSGEIKKNDLKISHKKQFIVPEGKELVKDVLGKINKDYNTGYLRETVIRPLGILDLLERRIEDLSGGELQKFEIAKCLISDADIYLLDEPTAYLDIEERIILSKVIRKVVKDLKKAAFVVDHDLLFLNYAIDSLIIFEGIPGKQGLCSEPLDFYTGMERFLRSVGITIRKDKESGRPRVNKPGSKKDREQRSLNRYFLG